MSDKKILNREVLRLELSIQDGIKKYGSDKEIIVFMHFPPITNANLIFIKRGLKWIMNKILWS